jgi:hypothetical protein
VMVILAHDRRSIVRFDITQHPTAGWLSRQVTEAFPWDTAPRLYETGFLCLQRDQRGCSCRHHGHVIDSCAAQPNLLREL